MRIVVGGNTRGVCARGAEARAPPPPHASEARECGSLLGLERRLDRRAYTKLSFDSFSKIRKNKRHLLKRKRKILLTDQSARPKNMHRDPMLCAEGLHVLLFLAFLPRAFASVVECIGCGWSPLSGEKCLKVLREPKRSLNDLESLAGECGLKSPKCLLHKAAPMFSRALEAECLGK